MCDIAPWGQICGCCIYNETKQEHNINMTGCVYKTIDNDVEQTQEYGWACLHPHGDLSEIEVESTYSKNYRKNQMQSTHLTLKPVTQKKDFLQQRTHRDLI